jgi:hypothetical protein
MAVTTTLPPIVFDIETGPESDDRIAEFFRWEGASPEEIAGRAFDASTVKYGNLKDQVKRLEKLEGKRAEFERQKAKDLASIETDRAKVWESFKTKAALSPMTGRVLVIGGCRDISTWFLSGFNDEPEAELLERFWQVFRNHREHASSMVGFNIAGFDVPFLVRRSWLLGVDVPDSFRNGRYLDKTFVDLADVWAAGDWRGKMPRLRDLAVYFGVTQKTGSGADFARLFEEDRAAAAEYLKHDLLATLEVAQKMGVIA